jgi:predicted AlkP superfamily phosphohydrolase/phosphomutase
MDEIVGQVMTRLQPPDLLMILSDHGFHSFRYGFSVNTWLIRNGYLAVKGQSDPATAYTDTKYLQDFDWPKTRAYALGLGMVFLNLQGREGQGIVPAADAPALIEELRTKLLAVTDPKTGESVFRDVYPMYGEKGESQSEAPDLQLGYADGYQTAKPSAAGAAPAEVFSPNMDKWSGEHASSDVHFTPGIFFCNKAVAADPSLLDLGVTALKYLGAPVPSDFEGHPLF